MAEKLVPAHITRDRLNTRLADVRATDVADATGITRSTISGIRAGAHKYVSPIVSEKVRGLAESYSPASSEVTNYLASDEGRLFVTKCRAKRRVA